MKLRLCTIDFKKSVRIQENKVIKTRKKGDSYTLIELGSMTSFDKPHFVGVISQDIINVLKVKREIASLEEMNTEKRVEWFKHNFPKCRIILIDTILLFDSLKDKERKFDPAVVISSAAELKWSN